MADPYVNPRNANAIRGLSRLVTALSKIKQMNPQLTGGANFSSGNSSGGGSRPSPQPRSVAPPVSVLANLPQTPIVKDLIAKGLINESMPLEQIQAIIAVQGLAGQVPIDIEALMKQINADYDRYTGDITTSAADWMKEMFGANAPTDPAMLELYQNDPMFTGYATDLAGIEETADLNRATDLAWLQKQQQAMVDYYNSLGLSVGQTIAAGGGGGGGGGGRRGGGRRGGGGFGGGSSGGDGEVEWQAPTTTTRDSENMGSDFTVNTTAMHPGMLRGIEDFAAEYPDFETALNDLAAGETSPSDIIQNIIDERTSTVGDIAAAQERNTGSELWDAAQVGQWKQDLARYLSTTGQRLVRDDPDTEEVEWIESTGETLPAPTVATGEFIERMEPLVQQAYSPESRSWTAPFAQEHFADILNRDVTPWQRFANRFDVRRKAAPVQQEQQGNWDDFMRRYNIFDGDGQDNMPSSPMDVQYPGLPPTVNENGPSVGVPPVTINGQTNPEWAEYLEQMNAANQVNRPEDINPNSSGYTPPLSEQAILDEPMTLQEFSNQFDLFGLDRDEPGKQLPGEAGTAYDAVTDVNDFMDKSLLLTRLVRTLENFQNQRQPGEEWEVVQQEDDFEPTFTKQNVPYNPDAAVTGLGGQLQANLLKTLRNRSFEDFQQRRGPIAEDETYEVPMGSIWQEPIPESEIAEMENYVPALNALQEFVQTNFNQYYQPQIYSEKQIDTVGQDSSIVDTSKTRDPDAANLAGIPDPNTLDLDEIDIAENVPQFTGYSRTGELNNTLIDAINRRMQQQAPPKVFANAVQPKVKPTGGGVPQQIPTAVKAIVNAKKVAQMAQALQAAKKVRLPRFF